jgi:hypothetical protein
MDGAVVFSNRIWAFGKVGGKHSVWCSLDGYDWRFPGDIQSEELWTLDSMDAPFFFLAGRAHLSFDGFLWRIGGIWTVETEGQSEEFPEGEYVATYEYLSKSNDGITWEEFDFPAGWAGRSFYRCVVFDDRMWLLGGLNGADPQDSYFNDVWSSVNGLNWVEETAAAPWPPRAHHGCVVHDGKMWVLGGEGANGEYLADVWYSSNGVDWTLQTESAPWGPRRRHGAVSYHDELLVIGGEQKSSTSYSREIWAWGTPAPASLTHHTTDIDQDNQFALSELLRVIQFFNAGGIACQCDTEDNFAPGTGDTLCSPHSSDYNPQDWQIDLNELLRAIQFYNTGGYTYCPESGTEDGFCPSSGL